MLKIKNRRFTQILSTIKEIASPKRKSSKGSWELLMNELKKKTPEPFKQPFFHRKKYTISKKKTKEQMNRIRTTKKQNINLLQRELNKNIHKNKKNNWLYRVQGKDPLGTKI